MGHPLESKLSAPAADIMEAISKGFRAQADVKGKLAELYFARALGDLKSRGVIHGFIWNDKDGEPDFVIEIGERKLVAEVKNIRSGSAKRLVGDGWGTVELQKTRNGLDASGRKTRGYKKDHFDVIAVCLFNQSGTWTYCYADSSHLTVRTTDANILEVYQTVTYEGDNVWRTDLERVIVDSAADADGRQSARETQREQARREKEALKKTKMRQRVSKKA